MVFVIFTTSIVFEQRPSGHGETNIRKSFIHELRFGEFLFRIVDKIDDEKSPFLLIPDNYFAASEVTIEQDEEFGILLAPRFFFQLFQ
jgi:hypothetical protein